MKEERITKEVAEKKRTQNNAKRLLTSNASSRKERGTSQSRAPLRRTAGHLIYSRRREG